MKDAERFLILQTDKETLLSFIMLLGQQMSLPLLPGESTPYPLLDKLKRRFQHTLRLTALIFSKQDEANVHPLLLKKSYESVLAYAIGTLEFGIINFNSGGVQLSLRYSTLRGTVDLALNNAITSIFFGLLEKINERFTFIPPAISSSIIILTDDQVNLLYTVNLLISDGVYTMLTEVSQAFGLDIHNLLRQLSILESGRYLKVIRAIGEGIGGYGVRLTNEGHQVLLHSRFGREQSFSEVAVNNFFGTTNIAFLNAGEIHKINTIQQKIDTLAYNGEREVADALKKITKRVVDQQDALPITQRTELLELLEELGEQASIPPTERNLDIIRTLLDALNDKFADIDPLKKFWNTELLVLERYLRL